MRPTTKLASLIAAASLVPALLAGCSTARGSGARAIQAQGGAFESTGALVSPGAAAPDFSATDVVTGQTVTLSQFKGKTVLLNFVNYGCNPRLDKAVSEQLLAIRQIYQDRPDFVPLSVFCGCCPPEALRQFAQSNKLDWPWVLDADGSIVYKYSDAVAQFGYPTLVVVDKEQTIANVTGAVGQADLRAALDKAAAGNGAEAPRTD